MVEVGAIGGAATVGERGGPGAYEGGGAAGGLVTMGAYGGGEGGGGMEHSSHGAQLSRIEAQVHLPTHGILETRHIGMHSTARHETRTRGRGGGGERATDR